MARRRIQLKWQCLALSVEKLITERENESLGANNDKRGVGRQEE